MRPHIENDMPACSSNLVADRNSLERVQELAARLETGMRHFPYEERVQRMGIHSLQRLSTDLIVIFRIFTDFMDVDPHLFFSLLPSLFPVKRASK